MNWRVEIFIAAALVALWCFLASSDAQAQQCVPTEILTENLQQPEGDRLQKPLWATQPTPPPETSLADPPVKKGDGEDVDTLYMD